ncbi:MAG: sortase [Patescibacteria group bacterium]
MENNFFNEEDLKKLFSDIQKPQDEEESVEIEFKPATKESVVKKTPTRDLYLKFVGLFVGIFILTFVAVNFSAISKNIGYFWSVQVFGKARLQNLATPTPVATSNFDPATQATLNIPKISASAPIIWNVSESQTQDKLLEGVVHLQGTALPGQKGNVFITGHSSYYSWVTSPYKDVFALLEKLEVGDKIYVQYQNKSFTYEITETKVVDPKNLSVLEQTQENNLTLMTCVPIGTNLNRLIIMSKEISTN